MVFTAYVLTFCRTPAYYYISKVDTRSFSTPTARRGRESILISIIEFTRPANSYFSIDRVISTSIKSKNSSAFSYAVPFDSKMDNITIF